MWRGRLGLSVEGLRVTLAATNDPCVGPTTPRVVFGAERVGGQVLAGDYSLGLQGLQVGSLSGARSGVVCGGVRWG